MTRQSGSKNKPKNYGDVLVLLQKVAAENGITITPDMKEKLEGLSPEEQRVQIDAALGKFASLELELEEQEVDSYQCGSCNAMLAAPLTKCPECGAELSWAT